MENNNNFRGAEWNKKLINNRKEARNKNIWIFFKQKLIFSESGMCIGVVPDHSLLC